MSFKEILEIICFISLPVILVILGWIVVVLKKELRKWLGLDLLEKNFAELKGYTRNEIAELKEYTKKEISELKEFYKENFEQIKTKIEVDYRKDILKTIITNENLSLEYRMQAYDEYKDLGGNSWIDRYVKEIEAKKAREGK
jgi:hypothetical protein